MGCKEGGHGFVILRDGQINGRFKKTEIIILYLRVKIINFHIS